MKVPLLDISAQLAPLREEIVSAVSNVIDSTRYIQGPEVTGLEEEVARYCNVAHAIGVSSGTDALLVSLMALDIGPGDRVLTTPYSFFATMGVILRVGARPVFADIDPLSYNIDPASMEALLAADTEHTIKAILPVHLYGQCADMTPIMKLADTYGLPVIEDAAQAIGAEYPLDSGADWQRSGSIGLAGCFSFFPSKNLGGIGDGGMVVSNDRSFAEKVCMLRNHGANPKYYHAAIGGNFRLDPIQATVLRLKLRYLEDWHGQRRENAQFYNTLFAKTGLLQDNCVRVPAAVYKDVCTATDCSNNYHIYNQYVISVPDRDELLKYLQKNDIGCEIYYPLALHKQECLRGLMDIPFLPNAEEAARSTLALPIYPELTEAMQEYVVQQIAAFFAK